MIFVCALCFACAPEPASPEQPIDDDFDVSMATFIRGGTIVGVGHTAAGMAALYDKMGTKVILLSPYESQNGPDLKIYLSKDESAGDYINLGKLKSTMGKQSYIVPSGVNTDEYRYMLVWCEKFSVLFARAELN